MSDVRGTIAGIAIAAAVGVASLAAPARAQSSVNDAIAGRQAGNGQPSRLLVEANEIVYNDDKNTVAASGDVELNYQGRTLQADRVIYDRKSGRVYAEGNARITESNGAVTTGSRFELTDDFKTGFIDSVRVEQTVKDHGANVKTRFAAPRGERVEGETTTFDYGTYTACEPCREHPERPPVWQVRAARIVHNNSERTVYYDDASFEFAGVPVAYIPYFWTPDPTVKRQTGLLSPHYVYNSSLGFGVGLPIFFNLAPNYDLTVQPTLYSKQGVLGQAEWRHRLLTGSYNIRVAGIFQQDDSAFLPAPLGARGRDGRGSIESTGRFNINENWRTGWDITALSDKYFLQNFKIKSEGYSTNYILRESTSTAYLQGQGDRSWFDLRGYRFNGLSYADLQKTLPIAGVLDYNKRIDGPAPLGGELQFDFNVTSLDRQWSQYRATNSANVGYPFLGSTYYGPYYTSCATFSRSQCIVQGQAGSYSRASGEVSWRRAYTDDFGQVWQPFSYVRFDGFYNAPSVTGYQNAYLSNFTNTDDVAFGRVMPAIGLEYRYPFVADAGRLGTHTLTPIAQIIARPDETHISRVANNDAHSLVFDDTTLFDWDKFSGYDRAEGGVRANVGLQYNMQLPTGFSANALFGQSYQVAGRNSYNTPDLLNTGLQSGLESKTSDYVARLQVNPSDRYSFIVRSRFDKDSFNQDSFETQFNADLKPIVPITASVTYARYAAQPAIGFTHRREALTTGASFALTPNWTLNGSILYDLDRYLDYKEIFATAYTAAATAYGTAYANANTTYKKVEPFYVAGTSLGVTYRDECTTFSLSYALSPVTSSTGTKVQDQTVLLRLELKTIGATSFSQNVNFSASADGVASN